MPLIELIKENDVLKHRVMGLEKSNDAKAETIKKLRGGLVQINIMLIPKNIEPIKHKIDELLNQTEGI